LLEHKKDKRPLRIHILNDGIAGNNLEKLATLLNDKPAILNIIDARTHDFKDAHIGDPFCSSTTFNKLVAAHLLPELVKAIWLDADTIINDDLGALWDWPMAGKVISAVEEPFWQERACTHYHDIGFPPKKPYFNAGVMVMALDKIREMMPPRTYHEMIRTLDKKLHYADQDILNLAFLDQWQDLPPRFNSMYALVQKKYLDPYCLRIKRDISAFCEKPAIIHFTDKPKPWEFGCLDPRKHLYKKYETLCGERAANNKPDISDITSYAKRRSYLWRTNAFIKQAL
jgi:lipopolysaccharide biosynthesis glycosyltransferase